MACDPELLSDVELFEHLGEEDRKRLAEAVDVRRLAAGEILFRAGEPGESLYIVRSGEVELFVRDNAGQKIPLTIACTNHGLSSAVTQSATIFRRLPHVRSSGPSRSLGVTST